MKMTLATKAILAVVGAVVAYLVLLQFNLIPSRFVPASMVPASVTLPTADTSVPSGPVTKAALPQSAPAKVSGPPVRMNIWAWNAQMGLIYANGGPFTTAGSLMATHGVNLKLIRQDDTEKTKPEQVKFAQALASGADNPGDGVHFAVIMGDGAAQYLAAMQKLLSRLGADYRAEIIGAVGYSRGEDGWWGPPEWKDNAEAMKGGATAGVLRDGDWNIAQFKLANDGIKNNPDERTWDPDAMNWFAADDYLKAAELYVSGYCEDREVVRNGKRTGEKHHTCVQGVVTWTPGDVNLAKKKGGLVRLLSTKENAYQMPAVVIGIHAWDVKHAKVVQDLLAAAFEGGDQVKTFPDALDRAGRASYAVYAEESPTYWVKYYKGINSERDKQGLPVPLGGSTVMNLADNLVLFGIGEGGSGGTLEMFRATYEGFGNIAKQQYPLLVPSFPKAAEAVNVTFLDALARQADTKALTNADLAKFDEPGLIEPSAVVTKKNWNVQFDTGKATFTPAAEATLAELYTQLAVGGALSVEIDGHTDNVGNPTANKALSEARGFAVKAWLEQKAPLLFPENRVAVRAFGDTVPVAPNSTADGRAKNRRVTIVLGSK